VKKLTLAAICAASCLAGHALAQDARSVIANAQRALGDVQSLTYSGSARDVAFSSAALTPRR
jgi:hypothetical protein